MNREPALPAFSEKSAATTSSLVSRASRYNHPLGYGCLDSRVTGQRGFLRAVIFFFSHGNKELEATFHSQSNEWNKLSQRYKNIENYIYNSNTKDFLSNFTYVKRM